MRKMTRRRRVFSLEGGILQALFLATLALRPVHAAPERFIRADANADGILDIADPIASLVSLFQDGLGILCPDAFDANDDGTHDIADPIYVLSHLFAHGAPPPAPFPDCGLDPTADTLPCFAFAPCGLIPTFDVDQYYADSDTSEVFHPRWGTPSKLFGDRVAYDVDSGSFLTTAELASVIAGAGDGIPPFEYSDDHIYVPLITPFHRWPNVIDLGGVFAEDPALAEDIIDQVLAPADPPFEGLSYLLYRLHSGARLFLARDFVTLGLRVPPAFEVHYVLFIDLDAAEAYEVRAHGQRFFPLPVDPHVENLNDLFEDPSGFAGYGGTVWALCLRGNTIRSKYEAVVVDRFLSDPEFRIVRMTELCRSFEIDRAEEEFDWIPPKRPPKNPLPVPVFDRIPGGPGWKIPGPGKPPVIHPGPVVPGGGIDPETDTYVPYTPEPPPGSAPHPSCPEGTVNPGSENCLDDVLSAYERLSAEGQEAERQYASRREGDLASELQQLLDRMRQVARLHNETARRVNAERIERSIGGYTYLEIFEPEAAGGVTLSDGSTISFEQGVKNPLAALLAQCGCMLNDVQVPREDGTTYGTVRADCRIFCQEGLCERPLEDLLAEFDATEACLANALAAIEAQIDTLERENNAIRDSDPRLRLLSLRTSIWENLFAEGIDLPGWVLVPGPPSAADLDVTGFLRDVAQGIYQRNLSVDEAINQAVSKHSEGRPVAAAAYDQLGYYMRVRYRKKLAEALAELGYEASDENIELLMTGEPPDDLRDELNRIEDNNARLGLLRIQAAILREAQLGFLESKQACLRAYYEQCLNSRYCEIHLTQVLFSAYRQLLQNNSYEIAWDERCRLCDRIRQILASSDPDSTLYSELFRQFLDCLRRKECPAGAEPRPCAGGKSGLPQAGGEAR